MNKYERLDFSANEGIEQFSLYLLQIKIGVRLKEILSSVYLSTCTCLCLRLSIYLSFYRSCALAIIALN